MAVDVQKRNQRQNAWQKQNTDRINFVMPKGYKAAIAEAAEKSGVSSSEFIRTAITAALRDCDVQVNSQDVLQSAENVVK